MVSKLTVITHPYCARNNPYPAVEQLPHPVFKKRLDKFWLSYDCVYLFRAQPLGTGSVK